MKHYLSMFVVALGMVMHTSDLHAKNKKSTRAGTMVILETSKGNITIRLFNDKSPLSCNNFLQYIDSAFYNGTIFHRVIPNFMIQGGGYTADLKEKKTLEPIKNESSNGLKNIRGTLSMARTSAPDSATSQFFINTHDNLQLDHTNTSTGYTVFGEVIVGMDIVDTIAYTPTRCPSSSPICNDKDLPYGMRDVPKEPIIIIKSYIKN